MLNKASSRLITKAPPKVPHWVFIYSLLFIVGLCLSLVLGSCVPYNSLNSVVTATENQPPEVVRIGYQPHGAPPLLKVRGTLEKHLAPMGVSVEWTEFAAGAPIMAAMGEGKIDIGQVGAVPALFAQADGVPFVYIANEPPAPTRVGIVVRRDSPIQTLADLKGKKIAFTKASSAHYLVSQALIKAGLRFEDVQGIYLPPREGLVALERKEVDAWAGWDPFFAEVEDRMPVRILTNGDGLTQGINFYVATNDFTSNHFDIVKIVIEQMRQVGIWSNQNPPSAAKIIARQTGLKLSTALKISERRRYEAQPIQEQAIEEQQRIAETFFRLGLLSKRIWVEDAVWKLSLGH
jgi:sulfonate transport system substrate-binding protein